MSSRLSNYAEPPTTRQDHLQPQYPDGEDAHGDSVLPHTVSFGGRDSTVSFATAASKHDDPARRRGPQPSSAQSKSDRGSRAPESVDGDGPASISGSSLAEETDATSASSAQRASREAGMTIFRVCGVRIAIPFTAWTFLAMSVPILFLIIVVARPLAAATSQLDKIQQLAPMAAFSSECLTELSRERLNTVLFLRGDTDVANLIQWRKRTDHACGVEWVAVLQRLAIEDEYFTTSFQQAVLPTGTRLRRSGRSWMRCAGTLRTTRRATRRPVS
jgi:hypothetical protein